MKVKTVTSKKVSLVIATVSDVFCSLCADLM